MLEQAEEYVLLIENSFSPTHRQEKIKAIREIQQTFLKSYAAHKGDMELKDWLSMELKAQLPEEDEAELEQSCQEILSALEICEEKQKTLVRANKAGRTKESWFAGEVKKAIAQMSVQETAKYMQSLDTALSEANQRLYDTILTQSGTVNMNPNLDGFVAEQYHAQTFNLNAEARGSSYRAKVLQPDGHGYGKNSVDLEIFDSQGKVVRRYQSKYCKDAEATVKAYNAGDYRGQQFLAPVDQSGKIAKKHTTVLEAPDGSVTSNSLSKQDAKQMQKDAQNGNWNELDWNEYQTKNIALGIGKQVGQATVMGAAIGAGMSVVQKAWNGEDIDSEEVIEAALVSGADLGVKTATAGALTTGVKKGIIKGVPKGTPVSALANIAHIAVENVKVAGKVATGELTAAEGLYKMEEVTVSTAAGIVTSAKGTEIGATIGTVLGPPGVVLGGIFGGIVGYAAGSRIGEKVVRGVQKIRDTAKRAVTAIGNGIKEGARRVGEGIKSFFGNVLSFFW